MGLRARPLHILATAPVVAIVAAASGLTAHAQAAAHDTPPAPVVVTIDPGHGGAPNNNDPTQPFDSGAIAASGLMEKTVTLDVAQRVAALLRQDLVDVVLTRTADVGLSTEQREQIGIDAHEDLFVSIHCNSFPTDPTVGGSLVLYPNSPSHKFAQALAIALGRDLASNGVAYGGTVLRDNWWIHNPVPTGTVEMAYLSNPREAALMATEDFRQQVAVAIRDGIESYDPQIALKRAQLIAWQRLHPGAPPPVRRVTRSAAAAVHRSSSPPPPPVVGWLIALATVAGMVWWRRPLLRALGPLLARLHRAAARRRRHRLRMHRVTVAADRRWAPHSVYDELSL